MRIRYTAGCPSRATALVALSFAWLLSGPIGAQVGFQGFEPGTRVTVDLESDEILDPLPFDVDFFFTGVVDADVRSVEARGLGFRNLQSCPEVLRATTICPAPGVRTAVVDCYPTTRAALRAAQEEGKQIFDLLVTPLEPNRYYCFEFLKGHKIEDPARKKQLRATIAETIEAFFASDDQIVIDPGTGIPRIAQGAAADLRTTLIDAVQASLAEDEALDAESGSYFDPGAPPKVGDRFRDDVREILETSINLLGAREKLQDAARGASAALGALSTSPLWQLVADALRAHAAEPRIDQLLTSQRLVAMGLIGLSPQEIVARSEGRVSDPATPITAIWDPAELDFTSTPKLIAALWEVAGALADDATLRQAAGLDEATLAAAVSALCQAGTLPDSALCTADPVSPPVFHRLSELTAAAGDAFGSFALTERADDLRELLARNSCTRADLVTRLVEKLHLLMVDVVTIRARTVAAYETRATWYMSADAGGAVAYDLEEVFTYGGVNVYFRPVNKKAPLRWSDFRRGHRWMEFRKRFSVMFGLPVDDVAQDDPNLDPLVQGKPALVAVGLRVTDYLRVSWGGLVFEERNPDPLVDEERLAWSPFLSLSLDWNIAGTVQKIFGGVFDRNPAPTPAPAPAPQGGS